MYLVDSAVRSISMQMHISELENRIWLTRRTYSQALEAAGYGDVISEKLHIANGTFLKNLKLVQLYKRMLEFIKWRNEKKFDDESTEKFAREMMIQAKVIQSEQRGAHIPGYRGDRGDVIGKRTVHTMQKKQIKVDEMARQLYVVKVRHIPSGKKRKKDAYKVLTCLNPICKGKTK